ncbi:MAG: tetratricopeptide repeat protein [Gammaproteobacteria bacterium]
MLTVSKYSPLLSIIFLSLVTYANAADKTPAKDINQPPKIKYSKITKPEKEQDIQENVVSGIPKNQLRDITPTELGEISQKFVSTLQKKHDDAFYNNLNVELIVRNSLAGSIQKLDQLSVERDNIIRGIVAIPDILTSKIGLRGHIKYLRLVKRNNGYRGLVRVKFNTGELSYLEIQAQKDKSGDVKIIDYYDLMLGRSYTTIVSQMLIKPKQHTLTSDKILIYTGDQLSFQDSYAQTIRLYQHGEYDKSLKSLQKLPVKFISTRDILLLRVQIAKATSRNAYREALVLLENKFSNDPDLGLLLSDHYFFTKQYNRALQSIEKFSEYIGGDIALDSLRVKILINQNQFKAAIAIGADAIKEDNSYEDIYWLLLKAYLHTYQYHQVGDTLDVLLDKFNAKFEIENFYKDPFYREYGFSKQFKKWKEKRVVKTKEKN